LQEQHAEEVAEGCGDHQVRGPRVNGAHKPAKRYARHDEAHAFVSLTSARSVVEEQQRAGPDLNAEEKQRHSAEVVPRRMPMQGDRLVAKRVDQILHWDALLQPRSRATHRHARLDTTIWSSRTFTSYSSRGRGGGPATLRPRRS